jgi:hypothetical protein
MFQGVKYFLVKDFEYYYAISLEGKVIVLPKIAKEKNSNITRRLKARVLKESTYWFITDTTVMFMVDGVRTPHRVIDLLSKTFELMYLNHRYCICLDGNKNNLLPDNLYFISRLKYCNNQN